MCKVYLIFRQTHLWDLLTRAINHFRFVDLRQSGRADSADQFRHAREPLGPHEFPRRCADSKTEVLVGGLEHYIFFHILGISLSQLTNIFQRGWNHQPEVSWSFHSHGGTPIAGWFIMEHPFKMDGQLGVTTVLWETSMNHMVHMVVS